MPEEMNVEFSHKLSEPGEKEEKRKARWEVLVELVEVAVLAIVAIATRKRTDANSTVSRT